MTNTNSLGDLKESVRPTSLQDITEATTLTKADNGTILGLNAAAGVVVNLPAVTDISSGWGVKIYVKANFATTNFTVVSATNVIQGSAIVAGTNVPAVNENTISFVSSAESIGDYVDLFFDGTNFIVSGSGVTTGAITFTAP